MSEKFDHWQDLDFWQSGEWDVVKEKLGDLTKQKRMFNPLWSNMFKALDATKFEDTKVVFLGQDPYPDPQFTTGMAFSVPGGQKIPPTLENILKEYQSDLHYPLPLDNSGKVDGDLTPWANEGVLLWNVIPSCDVFKSMSHDWTEWTYLTNEIIRRLEGRNVVFVAFGGVAQRYVKNAKNVIRVSHPSPRASEKSRNPFIGSRIFTRVNGMLCDLGKEPIDWRL